MVIAVDFDGTLFEEAYPEVGAPRWNVINYCKRRKAMGDTLILWTCRARKRLKMAIRACREVGLEFDYINNHTKESLKRYGRARRGCKILADVYIDDKAMNPKELEKMTYFKTADDEEPKCSECAHYTECNGKNCGPEHGWAYYLRYVIEEEDDE